MSKEAYRKCAKCGATRIMDSSIKFHRFPKPGTTNLLKSMAWATYCYPNQDWTSIKCLTSLYNKHVLICGRHFEESCYTDNCKNRLSIYAVPGSKEFVNETMKTLRTNLLVPSIVKQLNDSVTPPIDESSTDLSTPEGTVVTPPVQSPAAPSTLMVPPVAGGPTDQVTPVGRVSPPIESAVIPSALMNLPAARGRRDPVPPVGAVGTPPVKNVAAPSLLMNNLAARGRRDPVPSVGAEGTPPVKNVAAPSLLMNHPAAGGPRDPVPPVGAVATSPVENVAAPFILMNPPLAGGSIDPATPVGAVGTLRIGSIAGGSTDPATPMGAIESVAGGSRDPATPMSAIESVAGGSTDPTTPVGAAESVAGGSTDPATPVGTVGTLRVESVTVLSGSMNHPAAGGPRYPVPPVDAVRTFQVPSVGAPFISMNHPAAGGPRDPVPPVGAVGNFQVPGVGAPFISMNHSAVGGPIYPVPPVGSMGTFQVPGVGTPFTSMEPTPAQKKPRGILQQINKSKMSELTETELKLYKLCERKARALDRLRRRIKAKKKTIKENREAERVRELFNLKLSEPCMLLLQSEIVNSRRKEGGRRYTLEQKLLALTFYKTSPACYDMLRSMFSLPCPSTLNKMCDNSANCDDTMEVIMEVEVP